MLNLVIVFLLFEAGLLFFHLNMKFDPLFAELLFYSKFFILIGIFYKLNKIYYNAILNFTLLLLLVLLISIITTILFIIYYDYSFKLIVSKILLLGGKNKLPLVNYLFLKSISPLIYIQNTLPLFFLVLNFIVIVFYYSNKDKYFENYLKIASIIQNKYPI